MAIQKTEPTDPSGELEFEIRDRSCFFVSASARAACRVELVEMVHGSDDRLIEFFTVEGVPPEEVLAAAAESSSIADARHVRETDGESLFEFVVAGPCVGETLADAGAIVREVVAEDGVGHVVAHVPAHVDERTVVERFEDRYEAELLATRQLDRPAPEFTPREFRASLAEQLTDRQLEVLRTAYASGYFSWPRESTAEECAEALGISQPTFAQHLRAGERKLLCSLFDDPGSGEQTLY